MDDSLLTRYSRHILLEDIGIEGQERLSAAKVLLVGVGGLGSVVALYLATAGVNTLFLCDDDVVDLTNLQRQIVHSMETIGWDKTKSAKHRLHQLNPHCAVRSFSHRLDEVTADEMISQVDVVVDASDNFATRHLINRVCFRHKKPLFFGACAGFDGQISVFNPLYQESPCYNCIFSENTVTEDVRCSLLGVLAPLVGVVGSMQAIEVIKHLSMPQSISLVGRLLLIDARDMRWRDIRVPRDKECMVCGAR